MMEKQTINESMAPFEEAHKKEPEKIKFGKLGIALEVAENGGNARDIREYTDDFKIPTIEWIEGEIAMAWRENEPILIEGGTGIGKTRTVERMCAQLGYELYKLPCSSSTTEREMMGRYVSNPNRKSPTDPEVIFALGVIAEALRDEPGKIKVIYLDEINAIEGAVGARLHDILDEIKKEKTKGQVKLVEDAGEILEFDPKKVKVVATMNAADSKNTHAQRLSEALLRRFAYKKTVEELPDAEFLSIAMQRFQSNATLKDLPGIEGDGELVKAYSECHKSLQGLKRNNSIGAGAPQDFKFEDIDYLKRVAKKVAVFWEDGIFTDLPEAFREAVRIIYTGMIVDETERKMMEEQILKLDFRPPAETRRRGTTREEKPGSVKDEEIVSEDSSEIAAVEGLLEDSDEKISELKKALRAKKKEILGEEFKPYIDVIYKTKDEIGRETINSIEINFDEKLDYSWDFYEKHDIELAEDFGVAMEGIWDRNYEAIKEAIEQKGFDEILLIPAGLSVRGVHAKMSKDFSATYESGNFKKGGSFDGIMDKEAGARIVLIHKNNAQNLGDRPELKVTLGKKAEEFMASGEKLTLTDYLILQRQYFETTGKHLDEVGFTWLPGSTVKDPSGGFRVVNAYWDPDGSQLEVRANDPDYSSGHLGCRRSRCFK